jgi:multidrug efflux pump subunit AcrA (membrane-fusion protein)
MPILPIPAHLGAIVAAAILLGGCAGTDKTTVEVPPVTVTVVKPVAGSVERHFAFRATVVPRTLVKVVAETSAGRIVELKAEVGQSVVAGEKLAHLDDREIRLRHDQAQAERAKVAATLAQAQAQLAEAQATLDEARSQLKRMNDLVASGNVAVEVRDACLLYTSDAADDM